MVYGPFPAMVAAHASEVDQTTVKPGVSAAEAPQTAAVQPDEDVQADGAAADEKAAAEPDPAEKRKAETAELCRLLTAAADKHGVPHDFFIRLIWKESRFNAGAVSPVGAQGIAQFMPGTARIRGLKNPFDREEALFASASFLADLEARFGSWGLAAAGYNGGPNRVPRFVAGEAGLPYETIDYVFSITGRTAQHWALKAKAGGAFPPAAPVPENTRVLGNLTVSQGALLGPRPAPFPPPVRPAFVPKVDCPVLVARLGQSRSVAPPSGVGGGWTVWGAQVAGHPKRSVAMRQYARLKPRLPRDLVAQGPRIVVRRFAARGGKPIHAVQFAAPNRSAAQALCRRIAKNLAPCVVVKNG